MEQSIATSSATIVSIQGQAFAVDEQGNMRTLQPGDVVVPGELIITSQGAQLGFYYGDDQYLLGDNSATQLPNVPQTAEQAPPQLTAVNDFDVEALQQAILEGVDPTELFEATAAGGAAPADGGAEAGNGGFVSIDRIGSETIAQAGFDTQSPLSPVEQVEEDTNAVEPTAVASVSQPSPDQAPTIEVTAQSITEGSVDANTVIANFISNDPDGDTLTHSLLNDTQGFFVIDGNQVKLTAAGIDAVNNDELNLTELTITVQVEANGIAVSDSTTVGIARIDEESSNTVADSASTTEEQSVTIDVLSNDDLTDGATLTSATDGANGSTEIVNGQVVYTPNADFEGEDSFSYIITDEDGSTSTATVTVTVNDEGVPTAVADSATTTEEQSVTIDVTDNDAMIDGATLTSATSGANGSTEIVNGQVVYTPNADFEGEDSFSYTITDEDGSTSTATVTVTVNDEGVPVAAADTASTTEEQSVTIDVTDNDAMTDGATLTSATNGANGSTEIVNGQVVYTPNADFEGEDSFSYTITDEDGSTSTATVTVTVNDEGVPSAVADTASTTEEQSVTIDVTDNDAMTDGATLTSATNGANGSTEIVNGQVVYTPNADFEGEDSFSYIITDEDGSTSTATVTVTVNDEGVPVAAADTATTTEEQSVTIDVTDNDAMTDGATLTSATNGANGSTEIVNGQVVYTPNADFEGEDSFSYIITDEDGSTSTATVTVTVNDEGVPTAVADSATTTEEQSITIDVTDNDDLIDGATLTSATNGANGSTEIVNGQVVYTPNADFEGEDSFSYIITDEDGSTSTATVTVTVNDEGVPVAAADTASTTEEQSVTIDVTDNDAMTDGATLTSATNGANGSTEIVNGQVVYTPNADFEGEDSFSYTITDEDGSTSTATVTVTVNDEGVPVAAADTASTTEEQSVTIDVTDNDAMTDGATLTSATDGANGSTEIVNGQVVYTPNADFEGEDSFSYIITDEDGSTSTATVTVTVNDEGVPVAAADTATTTEEQSVTIDVTDNDAMTDGATLTSATNGANGSTEIVNGQVVYTPNADFEGEDSFSYIITDEDGSTSTATVTVTVNDEGVPSAVADTAATDEEQSVTIDVLSNDDLTDGATLTSATNGANGTTAIVDGQVVYTPNADFEGEDSFSYIITDEDGSTSTATVTVTVNDEGVPSAVADTAATDEEQSVTIDVLSNDDLTDGATLTSATNGANGTTAIVDGQVVYTPNADFEGEDSFSYIITDEDGSTSTATVTVTVNDEGVPVAAADTATTTEEQSVTIDVTDNDAMTDGATLTSATNGANGSTEIVNGQVVYTPNADFEGEDSFSYIITDEDGSTSTATVTVTVNDEGVPVAAADTATTTEEQSVTIDVLSNDDLTDGATLTSATNGANGSTEIVNGQVVYTPNADFEGEDSFSYTITDEDGSTSTATVTVTVNDEGVPSAVADTASTTEEQSVTIDVLSNDDLTDGATLTSATNGANGSTEIVNGQVVYTPNADFEGEDSFSYIITDEDGSTSTATVTVTVNDEGVPVAAADTASTTEEQSVTIDVTDNDAMTDGATLTSATDGANGSTEIVNGQVVYTPNADFEGEDSFSYIITDEDGSTSTATVTVTVNDEGVPVAAADTASTTEEQSVTIDVTGNDDLTDGATLTSATNGANGSTEIVNGQVVYTPNADFEGEDSFSYTITDEDGSTSTATVTVTVNDEGVPVAAADTASTTEEQSVTIDVTDNDAMTDGATLTSATNGANGSTEIVNGQVVYTPNADFEGEDSFSYTITDEDGSTSTATVTVTVNDEGVPSAVADTAATDEEQSVTIDVTDNDAMTDGATLTSATNGANGSTEIVNGQVVYTPNADFEGEDSFSYIITDEDGSTSTATVTVTVNDEGVPVAAADTATTTEEQSVTIDVLSNDDLTDGATLTSATNGANGSTEIVNGQVVYTPNADFEGEDSFSYTITDEDGSTSTATVTVTVNDEGVPSAVADTASTTEEQSVTIDVLSNDDLTDGATLTSATNGANGSTEIVNGQVVYTPNADFEGEDSFSYIITDEDGSTSTATVTVTVNDEGVPVAAADTASTTEEQSVTIDVLSNDDLTDGATLTSATDGANGSTEIVNGQVVYTPNADFEGEDSFSYTITDEDGSTSTATVTVTVNDEGVPVAAADTASTTEEQSVTIDVTDNDAMTDGATLTSATDGANGSTEIVNGQVVYTPNADFEGEDSFSYIITDEDGSTSTATVTVTVNDEGVPVAAADTASTTEEQSVTIDVTDNDAMTDGATLTSATDGANGSTEIVNGQVVYTPNADFEGEDSFSYTITDEDGSTSTATVTVTVNDEGVPVAAADTATTTEEQSVTIDVTDNDAMTDGATLTSATNGANGSTEIVNGQVVYTPNADFEGEDSFSYIITDEDGSTSTATVTVTVDPAPRAVDDTAQVFEAGLASGSEAGIAATTTSGNLLENDQAISDGLAISSIAYDGSPYTADANGVISIDTEQGQLTVYTEAYNGFAKGDYEYQLELSSSAGDNASESFGYAISDPAAGVVTQGTLDVNITDDAPVGSDVSHNLESSPLAITTNLVLVLDTSASMTNGEHGDGLNYLNIAVEALSNLINQADDSGNVNVQIIGFSDSVVSSGWLSDNVADALSYLQDLSSGGGTHYDAALNEVIVSSGTDVQPPADNTLLYFISDGEPNYGFGIDDTVAYNGLNGLEAWDSFVENNIDTSYGIGIGNADLEVLKDVASESASDEFAFIVEDPSDLSATIVESYLEAEVSASLGLLETASTDGFIVGADGGYVSAITIEGTTYTYDPKAIPEEQKTLTVTTALGGLLLLNFVTGAYSYELDVAGDGWGQQENWAVTVTDFDGDSSSINIEINTVFEAVVDANRDVIITNQDGTSTISVPSLALLWNDTGAAISFDGVDSPVGGSVSGSDEILFDSNDGVGLGIHDSNFETEELSIIGTEADVNFVDFNGNSAVDLSDRSLFSLNDGNIPQIVSGGYSYTYQSELINDNSPATAADEDWLKVTLAEGETLWANMATISGQERVKVDAYIYDSEGNLLTTDNGTTKFTEDWQGPRGSFTADTEGEYYLHIVADTDEDSGFYQMHLTIDASNAIYQKSAGTDVAEQFEYSIIGDGVIDSTTAELIGVHSDSIDGGDGDEVLVGNSAANTLSGEGGDDALVGYQGDDQLAGGEGSDLLIGGQGNDILTGGDDSDMFAWLDGDDQGTTNDTVTDFTLKADGADADVLDLSDLLQGETEASLESYLSFETVSTGSGVETIISIDKDGGSNGESVHQTITLKDVDFSGMSDSEILTQLIEDQQLNVDN
ncbi:Ig-like domain-containing protein [Agarivorans sp. MS3-6]